MDIDLNRLDVVIRFKKSLVVGADASCVPENQTSNTTQVNRHGDIEANKLKQPQKCFSSEEVRTLIVGYQSGKSTCALAKEIGCHKETVSNVLKKHGVLVTNRLQLDINRLIEQYAAGKTLEQIALSMEISSATVRDRLTKAGVKMRNRWDYKKF